MNKNSQLHERLKEVRLDLGYSQAKMAALAGISREMWAKYEAGAEPGAKVLAALAAVGVDVLYVLTGQRQSPVPAPALDEGDRVLLRNFHAAPLRTQNLLRAFIEPSSDTPGEIEERPAQKAA